MTHADAERLAFVLRHWGCSTCKTEELECGWDNHHKHQDIWVMIPLRFKCSGPPYRWYGPVAEVYCSAPCAQARESVHRHQ